MERLVAPKYLSIALAPALALAVGCSDPSETPRGNGDGTASGGEGMGATSGTGAGGTGTGGAETASGGSTPGVGGGDGGPAGVLFFSDFEDDVVGAVPNGGSTWTTTLPTEYDSQGIVEVHEDAGAAHSGSRFVYVKKGNDGQGFLQLVDAAVFPFTGSKVHVRAYVKVPTWPDSHASWMEVGAVTNEESEIRIGAHEGAMQVNHWPTDKDQIAPGVTMTPNTWHCVEYSYEPGTKTIEVWLDGTKIEALTVVGTFERGGAFDPAPPIDAIRFGAEIVATEAWYDDIAVGTGPLGCD